MTTPITLTVGVWKDPELRFAQGSGNAWCITECIYKDRKQNKSGAWEDSAPLFLRVKTFGRMAENVANSVERGDTIMVTGRLTPEEYETQSGEKRTSYTITADEVGLSMRWNSYTRDGARDTSHSPSRQPNEAQADPWASQQEVPF